MEPASRGKEPTYVWCALIRVVLLIIAFFLLEGALENVISEEKTAAVVSEQVQLKQTEAHVVHVSSPVVKDSELADIDLSDPKLNKAACTIQAQFRTHLKKEEAKKEKQESQQKVVVQDEAKPSSEGSDVITDIDLNDPELNKAASVIQASFRTHLNKEKSKTADQELQAEPKIKGAEFLDIDLEDPELNKAAFTIQASFRAHLTKEKSKADKQMPQQVETPEDSENKESDAGLVDADPELTKTTSVSEEKTIQENKEEPQPQTMPESHEPEAPLPKENDPEIANADSESSPEESKEEGKNSELASTVEPQEVVETDPAVEQGGAAVENATENTESVGVEGQEAQEVRVHMHYLIMCIYAVSNELCVSPFLLEPVIKVHACI